MRWMCLVFRISNLKRDSYWLKLKFIFICLGTRRFSLFLFFFRMFEPIQLLIRWVPVAGCWRETREIDPKCLARSLFSSLSIVPLIRLTTTKCYQSICWHAYTIDFDQHIWMQLGREFRWFSFAKYRKRTLILLGFGHVNHPAASEYERLGTRIFEKMKGKR